MHALEYWKIVLEVALLWYFIYLALYFIKGTRTEQLLKGLIIIGIIFIVTQQLHLEAINWVLTRIFPISVIALLIIFQPELRQGLARLGQFGRYDENVEVIEEISKAAIELHKRHFGALIAIEREVGLKNYIETGIAIDSKVSKEIILSVLTPNTPLHDGALIIRHDRIVAAGCLLPLTQDPNLSKSLGTRHRAALGLSEETDAVSIVVSEETAAMSIAVGGKMTRNIKEEDVEKVLKSIIYRHKRRRSFFGKVLSGLSPTVEQKG